MITALLIYVIAERLVELIVARRNTRALIARGGVEVGAAHYPVMVMMHSAWLISIVAWVVFKHPEPDVPLLIVYIVLQFFRVWVMVSLGQYWTTRIITLPDVPLVRTGPYKFLRHPNYVVVVLEIMVLPLAVDALAIALVFTVANALMLYVRIRAEEKALAPRQVP